MVFDDAPTPPPATMPGELSAAIDRLSGRRKHTAIHGWNTISAEERLHYGDLIYRAGFDWTSHLRCKYVISRLVKGATRNRVKSEGLPWRHSGENREAEV